MLLVGIQSAHCICKFNQPQIKNIQEKKNLINSPKRNSNLPLSDNDLHVLHCIYNYLHIISIVIGIISNSEMIYSIWEDVCRLHANAYCFIQGNLSICWFGCPGRSEALEPMTCAYQGQLEGEKIKSRRSLFFFFFGYTLWHMEVPAATTAVPAAATQDP